MPRRRACWFMSSANVASLPAACSASAIEASLPDWITMPYSRSLSGTVSLTGRKLVEPSVAAPPPRHACSLMCTGSSSLILPAASSDETTYEVMTLVMLAGATRVSASWEASTWPVRWSISTQLFAVSVGGGGTGVAGCAATGTAGCGWGCGCGAEVCADRVAAASRNGTNEVNESREDFTSGDSIAVSDTSVGRDDDARIAEATQPGHQRIRGRAGQRADADAMHDAA